MAHSLNVDASSARDTVGMMQPIIQQGNLKATNLVLGHLGFQTRQKWDSQVLLSEQDWGSVGFSNGEYLLKKQDIDNDHIMPDVLGMGIRDAMFLLESKGLKVQVSGRGKIVAQSPYAGTKISKGETCSLKLQL